MERNTNNTILLASGRRITLAKCDQNSTQENKKVLVDRVNNVWGSTAGAGSDFFHIYRKHRTREMERLKQLDEQHELQEEEKEFQQRYVFLQIFLFDLSFFNQTFSFNSTHS
jgi:hypothetical protein